MKISVKYTAQLKKEAGVSLQEFLVEENDNLQKFIVRIARSHNDNFRDMLLDDSGEFRQSVMIVYNRSQVGINDHINFKEGDEIILMSPIAGG